MAIAMDFSVRLLDILTANNCAAFVLGKPRNLRIVEIADFFGRTTREKDLREFPDLLKPQGGNPEESIATEISIRVVRRRRRDALNADKAPHAKKSPP